MPSANVGYVIRFKGFIGLFPTGPFFGHVKMAHGITEVEACSG